MSIEIDFKAQVELQILIDKWMKEHVKEARILFEEHDDHTSLLPGRTYTGVDIGGGNTFISDDVSYHTSMVAYSSVIQSIELISEVKKAREEEERKP